MIQLLFLLCCFTLVFAGVTTTGGCKADLPCENRPDNNIEFSSCSIIIPLDWSLYKDNEDLKGQVGKDGFNLKIYGLLVDTLWHDIPLRWLIKANKLKDQYDFIKNVSQVTIWENPTTGLYVANRTTWNMREFRGSAFVVPVRLTSKFLNVTQKYHERHQLEGENRLRFYVMSDVQPTTAGNWGAAADPPGLFLPVRHDLTRKPYVGVFDSSGKADIQLGILEEAGLRREEFDTCGSPGCAVDCEGACPVRNTTRTPLAQYRYLSKSDAKTLDDQVCLSLVTEPHFNTPEEGSGPFIEAAAAFVSSGGNFLAQCHGIDSYENCDLMQAEGKGCPGGSFLTDAGLIVSGAKNGDCEQIKNGGQEVFPAGADLPYVQYENQFDVIGGSVKSMCMGGSPVPNSKFWDTPDRIGFFAYGQETATTPKQQVFYAASGSWNRTQEFGSKIFYLTGHSYGTEEAGARLYMNAVLIPANRDAACGFETCTDFDDYTNECASKRKRYVPGQAHEPRHRSLHETKRQIHIADDELPPKGEACGCNLYYDACGVCDGTGQNGFDACGVCDGTGTYIDNCGFCRTNEPHPSPTNASAIDRGCCFDFVQNQDETGVDCGGTWSGCPACTPMPTPSPTPLPTPQPTPDPSSPCSSFGTCDLCTTKSNHPTRDCNWCGSTCIPNSQSCTAPLLVLQGEACPTPAPTPPPTPSPTPEPTPFPTPQPPTPPPTPIPATLPPTPVTQPQPTPQTTYAPTPSRVTQSTTDMSPTPPVNTPAPAGTSTSAGTSTPQTSVVTDTNGSTVTTAVPVTDTNPPQTVTQTDTNGAPVTSGVPVTDTVPPPTTVVTDTAGSTVTNTDGAPVTQTVPPPTTVVTSPDGSTVTTVVPVTAPATETVTDTAGSPVTQPGGSPATQTVAPGTSVVTSPGGSTVTESNGSPATVTVPQTVVLTTDNGVTLTTAVPVTQTVPPDTVIVTDTAGNTVTTNVPVTGTVPVPGTVIVTDIDGNPLTTHVPVTQTVTQAPSTTTSSGDVEYGVGVVQRGECSSDQLPGDKFSDNGQSCVCNSAKKVLCAADVNQCAFAFPVTTANCAALGDCCLLEHATYGTLCLPRAAANSGCVPVDDEFVAPTTFPTSVDGTGTGSDGETTSSVTILSISHASIVRMEMGVVLLLSFVAFF